MKDWNKNTKDLPDDVALKELSLNIQEQCSSLEVFLFGLMLQVTITSLLKEGVELKGGELK